jgi:LysM repeat protein/ABC-type branched-subunit amino acid transport system substrate-binding protein
MRLFWLLSFLLFCALDVCAQAVADPSSTTIEWGSHTVEQGQTLYAISKLYAVSVDQLQLDNPGIETGIRIGQVLRIRKTSASVQHHSNGTDTTLVAHVVKEGETLYSLSKIYGTTVEAIQNANHGLPSGLILGDTIMVPVSSGGPKVITPVSSDSLHIPSSLPYGRDSLFEEKYEIAFLMPFFLGKKDSLDAKDKKMRRVALQTYRGAQMAVDSLQKMGLNCEVFVHDVTDDKNKVQKVLAKPHMEDVDIIFGPLYKEQIADVCAWAKDKGTHVVVPVQQPAKVLLYSENMSKTVPGSATQWMYMVDFIQQKFPDLKVVLVDSKIAEDRKAVDGFETAWKQLPSEELARLTRIQVEDVNHFHFGDKLPSGEHVVVIVPTNDGSVLSAVFQAFGDHTQLEVFGPEGWDDQDMITAALRKRYHIHQLETLYLDYDNARIQRFVDAYRKKFYSEPGSYSFIGYDLMMFYGSGLKKFGNNFPEHFNEIEALLYCSAFDFKKASPESGYENQYVVVTTLKNGDYHREN